MQQEVNILIKNVIWIKKIPVLSFSEQIFATHLATGLQMHIGEITMLRNNNYIMSDIRDQVILYCV